MSRDTLVPGLLRQALADPPGPVIVRHPRSGLPYFRSSPGTPPINLEAVRQTLDEDV